MKLCLKRTESWLVERKHQNLAVFPGPSLGDVITFPTYSWGKRRVWCLYVDFSNKTSDLEKFLWRLKSVSVLREHSHSHRPGTNPGQTRETSAELPLRGKCLRAPGTETRTRNRGEASMRTSSRWANMLTNQLIKLLTGELVTVLTGNPR